jgi:hypothetical protein
VADSIYSEVFSDWPGRIVSPILSVKKVALVKCKPRQNKSGREAITGGNSTAHICMIINESAN